MISSIFSFYIFDYSHKHFEISLILFSMQPDHLIGYGWILISLNSFYSPSSIPSISQTHFLLTLYVFCIVFYYFFIMFVSYVFLLNKHISFIIVCTTVITVCIFLVVKLKLYLPTKPTYTINAYSQPQLFYHISSSSMSLSASDVLSPYKNVQFFFFSYPLILIPFFSLYCHIPCFSTKSIF